MVAAERLGIPYATVLVIAAGSFVRPEVVGEALHELRAAHGLPPIPPGHAAPLSRAVALSAQLSRSRLPAPGNGAQLSAGGGARSSRLRDGERAVYFTLGTVFNTESGDLFTRVLAGLRDLPVNIIVTVGHHIDPAECGPQPANVLIERYVAQAESCRTAAWWFRTAARGA